MRRSSPPSVSSCIVNGGTADLFNILKEEAGSDLEPIYGPERAGDIRDSLADISKAKNLLEYNPQVRIREGLQKTYQWFLNNQEFIYNN